LKATSRYPAPMKNRNSTNSFIIKLLLDSG
jgi:hypothetical protein